MARRSRNQEPEPAANGPEDVGFGRKAIAQRSPVEQKSRGSAGAPVRSQTVVPDPHITHGSFRVLQRVDGPFVIIDERLPPGEQVVDTIKIAKRGEGDAAGMTARDVALRRAEARCRERAYPTSEDGAKTQ